MRRDKRMIRLSAWPEGLLMRERCRAFILYFLAVVRWAAIHWWRWSRQLLVLGVVTGLVCLLIGMLLARWPLFEAVAGDPRAEMWTYVLYVLLPAVSLGIVVFLFLLAVAPSQIDYERQARLAGLEAKAKDTATKEEVAAYLRAQADKSEEQGDRIATRGSFYLWRHQWKQEVGPKIRRWLGENHAEGFEKADHLYTRPSDDQALYVQGECIRNATHLRHLAQQVESGEIPLLTADT